MFRSIELKLGFNLYMNSHPIGVEYGSETIFDQIKWNALLTHPSAGIRSWEEFQTRDNITPLTLLKLITMKLIVAIFCLLRREKVVNLYWRIWANGTFYMRHVCKLELSGQLKSIVSILLPLPPHHEHLIKRWLVYMMRISRPGSNLGWERRGRLFFD